MYGYNLHGLNGRHSTPEKGCEIKSVKVEPYSYSGGLGPEATGSHTRPLSSPSLSPSFPFPSPFLNLSAISFPPMLSHSLFHFPSSPPLPLSPPKGLRERCKLPHWAPGRIPGHQRIVTILYRENASGDNRFSNSTCILA